jgi:hypothetical protein
MPRRIPVLREVNERARAALRDNINGTPGQKRE